MAAQKKAEVTLLTQARLKELLDYDPITGFFRHIKQTVHMGSRPYGNPNSTDYICIRVDGGRYRAHQLAWLYMHGVWPANHIDHINGIRSDNRIVNLREATNTENCRSYGLPVNNTSGFKGVVRFRKGWRAGIKVNGRFHYIGVYATPEEAHKAYCEAAEKLHGAFWNPGLRLSHRRQSLP